MGFKRIRQTSCKTVNYKERFIKSEYLKYIRFFAFKIFNIILVLIDIY